MHIIKRNVTYIPPNMLKLIIQSKIFPIIDYGSEVYNDLSEILNNKIQRLQNACVRYILNIRRDEHITHHYLRIEWLKLHERRHLSIALLTWKILHNKTPPYLYNAFRPMNTIHSRINRFTVSTLQIPIHRTTKFNKSFISTGSRLYKKCDLHQFVSCINSLPVKKHFIRHFLDQYRLQMHTSA